jgi:Protein of unknown function (DUF3460)
LALHPVPPKHTVSNLSQCTAMSFITNAIDRFFYKPQYHSDVSNFITDLKRNRPSLEAEQRAGRALLWDKNVDRAALVDNEDSRVAQQAYVYQTQAK